MEIKSVSVNHYERNYFNDYDELRTDEMIVPDSDKVARAIDKLARRHSRGVENDVLFVTYDDNTGYRLMYDADGLTLRHYTSMAYGGWDKDEIVSVGRAKRAMVCE